MLLSILAISCLVFIVVMIRSDRNDYAEISVSPRELFPTDHDPWNFYYYNKHKKWEDLSLAEQNLMVRAAHIILDECGTVASISEIEAFLISHLPEQPTNVFDYGVMKGFREWQSEYFQNDR